jgi:hypothetical protein
MGCIFKSGNTNKIQKIAFNFTTTFLNGVTDCNQMFILKYFKDIIFPSNKTCFSTKIVATNIRVHTCELLKMHGWKADFAIVRWLELYTLVTAHILLLCLWLRYTVNKIGENFKDDISWLGCLLWRKRFSNIKCIMGCIFKSGNTNKIQKIAFNFTTTFLNGIILRYKCTVTTFSFSVLNTILHYHFFN